MDDNNTLSEVEEQSEEYLTNKEARNVKKMFKKYLKQYKEKDSSVSDQEWLERLFVSELPEMSKEEAKEDAKDIVESINTFDDNLKSINEAAERGVSKESWLSNKIQETSTNMPVQEYGRILQAFDDVLHVKNAELAEALTVAVDGDVRRVNMNPNLDGILAENLVAKTTELNAFAQGENIRVDVRESYKANSVDLCAIDLNTGKHQNYQLKFGKDAASTIKLIERGDYKQQLIVPSEQLEEVREYFKAKGSKRKISDHIEIGKVKGKSFTKDELKEISKYAQEEGVLPELDNTQDIAMSIGKNAVAMGLQSAAVTTGLTIASKIFKGERVEPDELVEVALKSGSDTAVKTVTAGSLQVAVKKGIIRFIPKTTPAGVIANIACVGIENVKILGKIASGELSLTKGLDQMGRTTTSMVGGLWAMAKGAAIGAKLTGWIPVIGAPLAVVSGFVGGMIGYFGGSKAGEAIYNAGKKVASAAKTVAKAAWNGIKSVGRAIGNGIKSVGRAIAGVFGF